jgi:hypothetical protein
VERKISRKLAALLALWLVAPAVCRAGPLLSRLDHRKPECPSSSYSPLHYWAPNLYRLHAHPQCGPEASCAPVSYPDLPIRYRIIQYPCPTVDSATSAAAYP